MKKINKKNLIVGIIIGFVLTTIITVTATTVTIYKADEISFTAEDSSFTASNINTALDTIYDNINRVATGSFDATPTAKTISVGFKPSKVIIATPSATSTNWIRITVYDSNVSKNQIFVAWKSISGSSGFRDFSLQGFSITDDGFTYMSNIDSYNGLTYYYAVK